MRYILTFIIRLVFWAGSKIYEYFYIYIYMYICFKMYTYIHLWICFFSLVFVSESSQICGKFSSNSVPKEPPFWFHEVGEFGWWFFPSICSRTFETFTIHFRINRVHSNVGGFSGNFETKIDTKKCRYDAWACIFIASTKCRISEFGTL